MVFNKIDAYVSPEPDNEGEEPVVLTLEDFKHSWMASNNAPAIFISATQKENLEEFRKLLYDKVLAIHSERYPYDKLLY
jgi:GTP-binding protein HflX